MRNILIILPFLLLGIVQCTQKPPQVIHNPVPGAKVTFSFEDPVFILKGPANARVLETESTWVHVFADSIDLEVTNVNTREVETFRLSTTGPQSVQLKNGSYIYRGGSSTSPDYSDFLPITFEGNFFVRSQNFTVNIVPETDHGLITVKDTLVTEVKINNLAIPLKNGFYYKYIKGGLSTQIDIREATYNETVNQPVTVLAKNHFNYLLQLEEGNSSASISIILSPFEYSENIIIISRRKEYKLKEGEVIELLATPNPGWTFDFWEEDGKKILGRDTVLKYTVPPRDVYITAHFKRN